MPKRSPRPGIRAAVALPLLLLLTTTLAPRPAAAVNFNTFVSLEGIEVSDVAWGDYDNDGDLDLAVSGEKPPQTRITRIYSNVAGAFTDIGAPLVGFRDAALAWGDVDGDGDLDLAVLGKDPSGVNRTILYRNDGGAFVDAGAGLIGLQDGSLRWGDVDNDGDLDLLTCGSASGFYQTARTDFYRNTGGVLALVPTNLPGVARRSSIDLGDMDGDGDLDLAIAGLTSAITSFGGVYRNDAGTWTNVGAPLLAAEFPSVEWGDFDQDGDLDLVQTGYAGGAFSTRTLVNDGTGGLSIHTSLSDGVRQGGARWADADSDGDLDLLRWGTIGNLVGQAQLGTNAAGSFTFTPSGLTQLFNGGAAWGDADGDGDADVTLSGYTGSTWILRVHWNADGPTNLPPGAPTGLAASVVMGPNGPRATFTWSRPTDDHTPQLGLSYELRIGTTPGGAQITGASADPSTGKRRVARLGQVGSRTSWSIDLPPGDYYWSVQAIDGALIGGPFAAEQSLPIGPLVDSGIALEGLMGRGGGLRPCAAWGDYDGDGDLDVVTLGSTADAVAAALANLWRNDGGMFVSVANSIPALGAAAAAWGDYDRDGDLDLVVSGRDAMNFPRTQLLKNNAGSLVQVISGLPAIANAGLAWGDIDEDGDLDLLLSGTNGASPISQIYLNSGGVFTDGAFGLEGINFSSVAFGDFDRDGDLDAVISGQNSSATRKVNVYRNDGASFALLASLAGVSGGTVAVGHMDDNSTPDIVLNGTTGSPGPDSGGLTKIYLTNATGTGFVEAPSPITGGFTGALALGDSDADGDLDIAYSGYNTSGTRVTRIARNDGGTFTVIDRGLLPVAHGALSWADVDLDGRLELLVLGSTLGTLGSPSAPVAKLYRNVGPAANVAPAPPFVQVVTVNGSQLGLVATGVGSDATPIGQLTYDVQVGTTLDGGEVSPLPALVPSGTRTLVRAGTSTDLDFWRLEGVAPGIYYLRVQAVDASFAGSALEGWKTVAVGLVDAPGDLGPASGTLALRSITPNPMRAQARIDYDLPRTGDVELTVYDAAGRRVQTLLRARMAAGRQVGLWDGVDDAGQRVPAGVYFVRLSLAGEAEARTERVVIAR